MMVAKKAAPRRLRYYAVKCESVRMVAKVGVAIARKGVPVLIPKSFRQEKRGKWMVAVEDGLLFPPYLFIAMRAPAKPWSNRANQLWSDIAEIRGVVRVMGCRDRNGDPFPLPIPYREMRKIRTKHRAGERKKVEVRFKEGQRVKILKGPFEGFDGIFDKPAKERVRILVSLFGRQSEIELEETDIRAA